MMKRLLLVCCLSMVALGLRAAPPTGGEYVFLVGGPSMYQWEKYKAVPHDHWWANFVRAARLRTEQIRSQVGPDSKITWLVYKQGYVDRATQEHQDLISLINTVRDKLISISFVRPGKKVIDYLKNGSRRTGENRGFRVSRAFEPACFMFDYSNNIDSACKSWLHENDLKQINRRAFARGAYVKSWGCHTGESMSKKCDAATGTHMIGAIGKTQFMMEELPILCSEDGRWVN